VFFSDSIRLDPSYAEAHNNVGVLCRDEGRISEAIASYDRCLKMDPKSLNAGQNRLLALHSVVDGSFDCDSIFREHCRWGQRYCKDAIRFTSWDNNRDTDRVLKIGYMSADFFTHSVSYFIEVYLHPHCSMVDGMCKETGSFFRV